MNWTTNTLALARDHDHPFQSETLKKFAEKVDVTKETLGGSTHHEQAEEQTASIHRVKGKPVQNRRCIVYFHGGRNVFGSAEDYEAIVNRFAVESDSTVINVNFRTCPETKFPLPIFDGYAAVKDILERASHFGIDTEKVCLCGDSGGATIALGIMQEMIRRDEQNKIALLF